MRLGLGILGLRQTRVRARARLRVLRWHGRHSVEVNKNINLGYSQDLASFPGLPRLQFLIACSMQKRRVPNPNPPFLHTASDQKLEPGKAWERG